MAVQTQNSSFSNPTRQFEEFLNNFHNDILIGELAQRCKIALEKLCDKKDVYSKWDVKDIMDIFKERKPNLYSEILRSDCAPIVESFSKLYSITTVKRNSLINATNITESLKSFDLASRLCLHPLWNQGGRLMHEFYVRYILPAMVLEGKLDEDFLLYPLKKFPENFCHGTNS